MALLSTPRNVRSPHGMRLVSRLCHSAVHCVVDTPGTIEVLFVDRLWAPRSRRGSWRDIRRVRVMLAPGSRRACDSLLRPRCGGSWYPREMEVDFNLSMVVEVGARKAAEMLAISDKSEIGDLG